MKPKSRKVEQMTEMNWKYMKRFLITRWIRLGEQWKSRQPNSSTFINERCKHRHASWSLSSYELHSNHMYNYRLSKQTSTRFQDCISSHAFIHQLALSFNGCYKVSDAPFIHSFIHYLLSTYHVPDTLQGTREITVRKMVYYLSWHSLLSNLCGTKQYGRFRKSKKKKKSGFPNFKEPQLP